MYSSIINAVKIVHKCWKTKAHFNLCLVSIFLILWSYCCVLSVAKLAKLFNTNKTLQLDDTKVHAGNAKIYLFIICN